MSKTPKTRTLFLVHHHLRRGGVTRVMFSAAEILRDAGESVCLLSGEAPSEALPEGVALEVMPALGYIETAGESTKADLKKALSALYSEGDIWHLHNHSLGKNPMMTDVFVELAEQGQLLVLQPHDFAEDGRPTNLKRLREDLPGFPNRLYPIADHIRYAVLQQRDAEVLKGGGVPEAHIHLLPNPVFGFDDFPEVSGVPEHCLYLTRAIRRKNVGEFVYWAACFQDQMAFATSLIPENPSELLYFKQWQAFAEAQKIPLQWGIGMSGKSFKEVVSWADVCVTTSVGEGFGMSFLEPFGMGRGVIGRDLPSITSGFCKEGLDLSALYTQLPVPVDALDTDFWSRALKQIDAWRVAMGAQGHVSESDLKTAWVQEGQIDFGRLDECGQQAVLQNLQGTLSGEILNPFVAQPLAENKKVIMEKFGAAPYYDRLEALYGDLKSSSQVSYADGDRIRDAFLALENVCLLRT